MIIEKENNSNTFEFIEWFLRSNIDDEYIKDYNLYKTNDEREEAYRVKVDREEKLETILNLQSTNKKLRFLKMFNFTSEKLLDSATIMQLVLSYGAIISKLDNVNDYKQEENYILSAMMMNLSIDEYDIFGSILSDHRILKMFINNIDNVVEINKTIEKALAHLEITSLNKNQINNDNLREDLINNILYLVECYEKVNIR